MSTSSTISNKRIAKNTLFLYIRLIFVLFVSLYTTRVVLNILGQEDYGINNVVAGFVSMFAFLNSAMSNGIQRFFNYERTVGGIDAAKSVYNHALVIQFIIVIIIVFLAETVGLWYLGHKMVIPDDRFYAAEWIYQLSILSLVIVVFTAPFTAVVMSHEKMGYFAFVSVLDAILKLVFIVLLQFVTVDKLIFYGFLQVIISLISFILYFVYSHKNFEEVRFRLDIRKTLLFKMLSFSGWNLMGTFAYTVKGQGLNILLNVFFGPIINAARGISFQILGALQGFTANLFVAIRPQLVESYAKGDYDRTRSLMYTMSKMSFYLLYMFALPVMLEIDYILSLWLGAEVPKYTASFTILIILNMLISNFNTPVTLIIHAIGKMKLYQCVTSVTILSILPISWVFLELYKTPLALYWVSLVLVTINQVLCILVLRSLFELRLKTYVRKVILPTIYVFVLTPILPFVIRALINESFFRFIMVGVISLISMVLMTYMLGLEKEERVMIKSYVIRIKQTLNNKI